MGLTLVPAPEFPGSKSKEGVAVSGVDPNSKAADQGLKRGDVILEVNGKTVSTPDDVSDSIRDARDKGRKNVLLQIRSRDQQQASLPFPSRERPTWIRTTIVTKSRKSAASTKGHGEGGSPRFFSRSCGLGLAANQAAIRRRTARTARGLLGRG